MHKNFLQKNTEIFAKKIKEISKTKKEVKNTYFPVSERGAKIR